MADQVRDQIIRVLAELSSRDRSSDGAELHRTEQQQGDPDDELHQPVDGLEHEPDQEDQVEPPLP
nr:hypothetical protein [Curtobacterium sp. VKM Ac-1395]